MPSSFDVAVIGGGVMGCSALHYLAKLGVSNSVLLERDGLAEGSTGRSMAILRMHYSNVVTTQMAWWSRGVIAEFEQETGHPGGFVNTGYCSSSNRVTKKPCGEMWSWANGTGWKLNT